MKTNAARILDRMKIAYRTLEYEVDLEDLSAVNVAAKSGVPLERIYKTLLCHLHDGRYVFAVVPGASELSLKKLSHAAGVKNAEMASLKDVEPLTGYVRGGVTVLGAKKNFEAYVDETLELWDEISVSAGMRGMQIILSPADYLRATQATLADLTKEGVSL